MEVLAIVALAVVGFVLWDYRPSAQERRAAGKLAEAAEKAKQLKEAQDNYEKTKLELAAREVARKAREHDFMLANKGYGKVLTADEQKIEAVLDANYPKVSDFYERLAEEGIELHTTEAHAVQFTWWQEEEALVNAIANQGFSR
ncbi:MULTISPECIES: hypothetical protein [unclassified Aeromonas]|uniref:hypothetical protein n=1 Tax=unclassified Aeromonas TaxID=257493 RepID=UPI000DF81FA4|nr:MULTISPECIES: hypothetical protein [unclassified Aeromonas]RDD48356.1 hypothetical protein ASJ36_19775 [Aeromonas sp. ARM81]